MQLQVIQTKIYEVRGQKVMLDFDLAELYERRKNIKRLNEALKEILFLISCLENRYRVGNIGPICDTSIQTKKMLP